LGLPFQALMAPPTNNEKEGRFLLENHEVIYGYSATAVQAAIATRDDVKRKRPTQNLLAIADPEFGGTARFTSSTRLAKTAPPKPSVGKQSKNKPRPIGASSRPIGAASRPSVRRRGPSAQRHESLRLS
jgi:hypothetical protein